LQSSGATGKFDGKKGSERPKPSYLCILISLKKRLDPTANENSIIQAMRWRNMIANGRTGKWRRRLTKYQYDYLRQGGNDFAGFCLFVCLFVCL